MKTNIFSQIVPIVIMGFALMLFVESDRAWAQTAQPQIGQLLAGIKWEKEHTNDKMLALELAMDHLESIPDYYTRLERMDWECRSEKIREM